MATWQMVLDQNADLTVEQGSLSTAAAAVGRGADLRLYLIANDYEETLFFQQTYAGEGEAFAGLMSHHHSYSHRGSLADQPYLSFFKYDTSGSFSHVKWMLDNRTFDEGQAYPYGVYRWYVCDKWRVAYEHDEAGRPVSGSLDDLCEHIRAGHSIKVGVRQWFGAHLDDPSGPQHTSYFTVMQPLIRDGQAEANCDFVLSGAPRWPFTWRDGLAIGVIWPSTTGELTCHFAEPGHLPFRRTTVRRAMQWLVADDS